MQELFIFGTVWFWTNISLIFILLYISYGFKNIFFSIAVPIAAVLLFYFFSLDFRNAFTWVGLLYGSVLYLMSGVLWSFYKWYKFCKNTVAENNNETFRKRSLEDLKSVLNPAQQKVDIYFWTIYWPFSVLNAIFSDLLVEIGNFLRNLFKSVYEKISASVLKDLK